jgi:hypothetical protein
LVFYIEITYITSPRNIQDSADIFHGVCLIRMKLVDEGHSASLGVLLRLLSLDHLPIPPISRGMRLMRVSLVSSGGMVMVSASG